ncbi:hypothetical protein V8F06_014056, partial [Rhypophila decipiens]
MLSPSLADLEQELKTLGPPSPSYSLGRSSKLSVKHDKDDPFDIFMFIPFGRWCQNILCRSEEYMFLF